MSRRSWWNLHGKEGCAAGTTYEAPRGNLCSIPADGTYLSRKKVVYLAYAKYVLTHNVTRRKFSRECARFPLFFFLTKLSSLQNYYIFRIFRLNCNVIIARLFSARDRWEQFLRRVHSFVVAHSTTRTADFNAETAA